MQKKIKKGKLSKNVVSENAKFQILDQKKLRNMQLAYSPVVGHPPSTFLNRSLGRTSSMEFWARLECPEGTLPSF